MSVISDLLQTDHESMKQAFSLCLYSITANNCYTRPTFISDCVLFEHFFLITTLEHLLQCLAGTPSSLKVNEYNYVVSNSVLNNLRSNLPFELLGLSPLLFSGS